jgi:hypothetical protein
MLASGLVAAAALAAAGAASAQELKVEDAAARLIVIPEARNDVQVIVTQGAAGLPPLQVRRLRDGGVEIDGGLERRIQGCNDIDLNLGSRRDGTQRAYNRETVRIRGVGEVAVASLPVITARVPLNAEVAADGAIFGTIGRTRSLELAAASCGTWSVANVEGELEIAAAGSGDIVVGTSRTAEIAVAGSGDVRLGPVGGPLQVSIAGSGDVRAVSVAGGLSASIAGSGDVLVEGGRTGSVSASIVGSGDVRLAGAAQSVNANIMGSGDVRVGQVTGAVRRSVMGSGDVIVGR